ncbi:uncharacterized protein LOC119081554 isoform X1 [Bradysia coprophila]|uniref:uncharacterized protein LOC119081554 isoform X1 n=1 Tax=Bradysia coprophila TaxID=38358 RepID=UPI00187DCB49|nr:uncharacterized protein LOC119081554 isoform X1 [Bradysia coprophila]
MDISIACGGYSLDLVEVQSGPDNNIKFKEIIEARVTDDCRTVGAAYLTIERPFTSALISIKIRQGSTDLFTIKNKELGEYLSNIDINGLEFPILEAGTVLIRFAERANISEYGPFLGFIAGQINVLLKVCYDGNEYNPDVFAMVINITRKNSISSVY